MTICDWPLAPYHFVAPYFTNMALYPVIELHVLLQYCIMALHVFFYGTAYCDTAVFYFGTVSICGTSYIL